MEPEFVIAGCLSRDTILPLSGGPLIDSPGGSLIYSAAGMALWGTFPGLLGRVGENYPQEWLKSFERKGFDIEGVTILPEAMDLRFFAAYKDAQTSLQTNPVAHFARLGLPFPKWLLGYQSPGEKGDLREQLTPSSPRSKEIPGAYLKARAVHICPMDLMAHEDLTWKFHQAGTNLITLDPGRGYPEEDILQRLYSILKRVTAFLPSEEELRSLFWGKTNDVWEMTEGLASLGCKIIVVKRGGLGQLVYDSDSKKRWNVPAYPASVVDPTGTGDSFCGGFVIGLQQTNDPLRACLHGNISASVTIEGSGAFHALESLPGLAQARLNSLSALVRQV